MSVLLPSTNQLWETRTLHSQPLALSHAISCLLEQLLKNSVPRRNPSNHVSFLISLIIKLSIPHSREDSKFKHWNLCLGGRLRTTLKQPTDPPLEGSAFGTTSERKVYDTNLFNYISLHIPRNINSHTV
jgi:hypothetical protein